MYKFLLVIFIFVSSFLYSQDIFTEFVDIYNRNGKSYKLKGTFTDIKDGKKTVNNFELIVGKDYKLMYLKDSKSLFLANKQGFFVMGANQVSALKIAANYVITGAANMNDLMSIDFINDYKAESINDDKSVNLVKKNRVVPYSKGVLKKSSNNYTIDFFDNSGKALKRAEYKKSSSTGYFDDMYFSNLIINTNISTVCSIKTIEPSDVSSSYFRSENIKMLFSLFK
ncbi:hypothetical protein [uncultured Brachyspira sp.]|uniref:hypothetical protein n=1 Tax=uncultured Brachyspira sp. TaxID=221953 RepID=UPI0025DF2FDF|nr:hypothetical protein [uncultured Brachyspira sp.]